MATWGSGMMVVALVLLAGCVSMTPQAKQVHVVGEAEDVQGCTLIGNATATMRGGIAQVTKELRNEAASQGGDTVLLLSRWYGMGAIYRCGAPR